MLQNSKNIAAILICFSMPLSPATAAAKTLTAEDLAVPYVNEDLGFSIKIPHTWVVEKDPDVLHQSREAAQDLASKVLGVSKEYVQEVDAAGSEKLIIVRMHAAGTVLPSTQITTRSFKNVANPPASSLEHLKKYMQFIQSMTPVTVIEPLTETELNGSACTHVAYHTRLFLNGYTYLARYDVYSFWRKDRVIDLTIISDRNSPFKTQDEMDTQTLLHSIRI